MKERPILMHARSINGILAGRKTQTRRIVKPQPDAHLDPKLIVAAWDAGFIDEKCPYGKRGDRLWVRETWGGDDLCGFAYRADHPDRPRFQGDGEQPDSAWKPSIHMPRIASRLILEITGIRVDRVQGISERDAKAEGFQIPDVLDADEPLERYDYRTYFRSLWDDTNGKGAWERNDWCWVVDFKPLTLK